MRQLNRVCFCSPETRFRHVFIYLHFIMYSILLWHMLSFPVPRETKTYMTVKSGMFFETSAENLNLNLC